MDLQNNVAVYKRNSWKKNYLKLRQKEYLNKQIMRHEIITNAIFQIKNLSVEHLILTKRAKMRSNYN